MIGIVVNGCISKLRLHFGQIHSIVTARKLTADICDCKDKENNGMAFIVVVADIVAELMTCK